MNLAIFLKCSSLAVGQLLSFTVLLATACHADEAAKITEGDKKLPLAGESFKLNGRDAFIILPKKVTANTPWVWYAPTLRGLPSKAEVWMFERFLAKGIAIAGIDVGESYGSPDGRKLFSDLPSISSLNANFPNNPAYLPEAVADSCSTTGPWKIPPKSVASPRSIQSAI
jgi:hypothetical protein